MKTKFSINKAICFSLVAFLVSTNWSCKENTILPKDLVPAVDNINTFDSNFNLITHTLYQDSFLTGGKVSGLQISSSTTFFTACGTIKADPSFGKTVASMHVEVLPAVPHFTFKTGTSNMTIDSVILSIPFKQAYGDTNASAGIQHFNVYRSLKAFRRDSAQYEFTKDSFNTGDIMTSLDVNFDNITDSPKVNGVSQQPSLRFKLPVWFADSLKAQVDSGTTGALSTFTDYLAWWKGFAIVPDSSNGKTIGYFDSYRTRMTIYYRYPNTTGGQDTVADVFSFDPNYCNRFNTITHNYSGTVSNNFINTHSAPGDSLLFIQNEPGLVNIIQIPGLDNMDNVIVNKAELVFTTAASQTFSDTSTYWLIPRLQIFKTDSSGNNDKVAEDYAAFNSSNYVDGKRSQVIINGISYVQYKFTVTYSIQKIISQKDSTFRFKIMGVNSGLPAAYRTILAGSGSNMPEFKPRLYVIYTKINKP